jgi:hypothetical protein
MPPNFSDHAMRASEDENAQKYSPTFCLRGFKPSTNQSRFLVVIGPVPLPIELSIPACYPCPMKRDMDLCREILLRTEKETPILDIPDHPTGEILAHFELLLEAGFLQGQVRRTGSGEILLASFGKLTWAGHDFLDAARNDGIWNKAKNRILLTGGAWTFDLLKHLLLELAKKNLMP